MNEKHQRGLWLYTSNVVFPILAREPLKCEYCLPSTQRKGTVFLELIISSQSTIVTLFFYLEYFGLIKVPMFFNNRTFRRTIFSCDLDKRGQLF